MLGQYSASASAGVDNRVFVYEVSGLQPSEVRASSQWRIRKSDSQFVQVPFHRMNEEMQRLTRLGGRIINIWPLGAQAIAAAKDADAQPENTGDRPAERSL